MQEPMRARFAIPSLLVVVLTACGGGGGGGGGSPEAPSNSGLIPAAPALGATLEADATVFRPFVANGVWTYRGVDQLEALDGAYIQGTRSIYENVIRHVAAGAGSVTETASNIDNTGAEQQTVSVRSGEVRSQATIDLGDGNPRQVQATELRSPVRVGDQYTLLDIHEDDAGVDVDGDGKNEALDLAMYSRVIGAELVDLVSYPQAPAVHVQTVVRSRAKLSSTDVHTDLVEGTLDLWYVAGVGIVKRRSDLPGDLPNGRQVITETLVSWDGVDRGVGAMTTTPVNEPGSGRRLEGIVGAVGFDAHALLMSNAKTVPVDGIALSRLTNRGEVVSTAVNTTVNAARAKLFKVGNGARVVAMTDSGMYMYLYDSSGEPTSTQPVLLKAGGVAGTASNDEFVGASSGSVLWVVWNEPSSDPSSVASALQAQPFDASGKALRAPIVLSNLDSRNAVGQLKGAGTEGRVIFSWDELQPTGWGKRYAIAEGDGTTTMTLHTLVAAGLPNIGAIPAATTVGSAFVWYDPFGTQLLSGVTVDAQGEPLRSNSLTIDKELLSYPWSERLQYVQVSGSTKLDLSTLSRAKLWPEDDTEAFLCSVVEMTLGGGPLATNNQARLLARGTFPWAEASVTVGSNILLFSNDLEGILVTPVWRRP